MFRPFGKKGNLLNAAIKELSNSDNEKSSVKLSSAELVIILELIGVLGRLKAAMSYVKGENIEDYQ